MLLIQNMPSAVLHNFRAFPVVATYPLVETLNDGIKQTLTHWLQLPYLSAGCWEAATPAPQQGG